MINEIKNKKTQNIYTEWVTTMNGVGYLHLVHKLDDLKEIIRNKKVSLDSNYSPLIEKVQDSYTYLLVNRYFEEVEKLAQFTRIYPNEGIVQTFYRDCANGRRSRRTPKLNIEDAERIFELTGIPPKLSNETRKRIENLKNWDKLDNATEIENFFGI